MSETQRAHGTVWAVFGHRLAIEGPAGRILADLGPEGMKALSAKERFPMAGDTIHVEGARKPTEIKVARLTVADGTIHEIEWDARHDLHHPTADPEPALEALRRADYRIMGEPTRKPKHFELRAIRNGGVFEVHVALDGTIRKAKALDTAS